MSGDPGDPTAIGSIAVTVEDVVAALEARRRTGRRAVLRVTPPFSGRMRARIHVAGRGSERESGNGDGNADPDPVHLHPERLVADVPAYPDPGGTGERPPGTGDRAPAASVEAWRAAVRESVVGSVTLPGTDHRADVTALGGSR
ncbi:MAG: hypothetical protein ABEH40_02495 [Haloferacaceae archaeon]